MGAETQLTEQDTEWWNNPLGTEKSLSALPNLQEKFSSDNGLGEMCLFSPAVETCVLSQSPALAQDESCAGEVGMQKNQC